MIIDEILDRKDWLDDGYDVYNAHDFYIYCVQSMGCFGYGIGGKITAAMDYGTNEDVQNTLCDYIMEQGYNPSICEFVRSVNWIENGEYRHNLKTARLEKNIA